MVFLVWYCQSDAELNPGPMHFPCYKPVHINQCTLLCDICAYWCHCGCCGVDTSTYISFQNVRVFNWTCSKCITDVMPFHYHSVLRSSGSDTSDIVSQSGSISLTSSAGLRVGHLNCCSLLSVAAEMFDLFTHQNIGVFAITVAWLDSSIADSENIAYTSPISIVHNDRNHHGGEVGISSFIKGEICGT